MYPYTHTGEWRDDAPSGHGIRKFNNYVAVRSLAIGLVKVKAAGLQQIKSLVIGILAIGNLKVLFAEYDI